MSFYWTAISADIRVFSYGGVHRATDALAARSSENRLKIFLTNHQRGLFSVADTLCLPLWVGEEGETNQIEGVTKRHDIRDGAKRMDTLLAFSHYASLLSAPFIIPPRYNLAKQTVLRRLRHSVKECLRLFTIIFVVVFHANQRATVRQSATLKIDKRYPPLIPREYASARLRNTAEFLHASNPPPRIANARE